MFAKEQPRRQIGMGQIVSKPAAAPKGPAMAAPNQKALVANKNSRKVLEDIGNVVGVLNAKCNINKDGVLERSRVNLVVNANKGASSSTQQSQAEGVVARAETKAEAVVWGNKQRRTIKRRAQYATGTQKDTVISANNGIETSAQDGTLETPSQLKARDPRAQSLTSSLTARSKDACRDFHEVLSSIDDGDLENQLAVVEYVEDIYKFYRKIENMSCVPPDYMTEQIEINEKMRAILIDWLIEVHLKFDLMPETLYLTVNIIDRYLSVQTVTKGKLQLVGITAMLIACKYEEIWPPQVNDFVGILPQEYTSEQMVAVEHTILNRLKFNLTVPTPYVFLVRFLKAAGPPDKAMENLAFFLVELCLLHYTMIKYSPSMLAAAAVYTAQCTLRKDTCWSKTLALHTGYSEEDLKECAHFMVNFHMNAGRNKLRVVHRKYSIPFFGCVAFLAPANLPGDDSCSSSN